MVDVKRSRPPLSGRVLGMALTLFVASGPGVQAQANPDAGRTIYGARCATCHGVGGKGDGPAAVVLVPKPGDHTNARYMATLSDEFLRTIIHSGGASVKRSPKMPPAATLSDPELRDVVAFIRSLSKAAPRK